MKKMNFIAARFVFKKRYLVISGIVLYLFLCQACMTMRFTSKETTSFFSKSQTTFQDTTFQSGGPTLHYVATGSDLNPVLFFVHGSPGSWNAFKEYLVDPDLLKKYRMIAIDRPGFGYSDFGDAQNLATQSQLISTFIKSQNFKKPVTLVGHSLGGPLVAQLAVDHPEWYHRLVVLAGSLDPKAEKPEKWRTVIKIIPLRYLIPGALKPSNDELWWLKKDLVTLENQLYKIDCEVTIVHGTKDVLVPYSNVDYMKEKFVNAKKLTVKTIPEANHFIPWSHYDIVKNVILDEETKN